jgi:hypothetical protein
MDNLLSDPGDEVRSTAGTIEWNVHRLSRTSRHTVECMILPPWYRRLPDRRLPGTGRVRFVAEFQIGSEPSKAELGVIGLNSCNIAGWISLRSVDHGIQNPD